MGQESIILRLCLQADPGANRQVLKVEEGEQFARGMFAKPVAWDAVLGASRLLPSLGMWERAGHMKTARQLVQMVRTRTKFGYFYFLSEMKVESLVENEDVK